MKSLRVLLTAASLSCFSLPLLADSHSESKSFHGWTATVTNYAKDNFSRSCSLIAQPYQLATSPNLVGSNPTDLFIAITHNKLNTTENNLPIGSVQELQSMGILRSLATLTSQVGCCALCSSVYPS